MPDTRSRRTSRDSDVVYTPDWIVADMLAHFKPAGEILDPCRGLGVFHSAMPNSDWCEITEGRDFFDWSATVDWVVGNPPYSLTRAWLNHSYTFADNILYLIPVRNIFSSYGTLREIADYGGVREVRLYGTGNRCGFPMGNAIGAFHIQRGYTGPMVWSDQAVESESAQLRIA